MKTIDVNNNISAPKPARNLNFPYVNTTFIEADWEAPADQSDCIDYYQVCMTVSGGTACVNQTLDNPTTSYPELRPCTLHTVDVTAWTEGARSSVISAQVNTHNEVPDVPTSLHVNYAEVDKVNLEWHAPVANHECVEWYEVCWKGEQIESCNNSTDIQDFITGLTPCGEYSANVTAVGAAGSSVTSHLVVHTRNIAFNDISILEVKSSNSTTLEVEWAAPTKNSECVQEYKVCWIGQETGEKGCTTQTRAITKATITGLISCVNYTVNVTAGGVLKNSNAVSTPVMTNSTLMQDKPAIQNLSLSRDSEGNITVTWHPLVEGMMCVRSYNVCWEQQSQPEDNQCLELPSSENHLTISGLHSGATYTVEVSAVLVTGETSEIIREDIPISGCPTRILGIVLKKDFQPKLLRGDHVGGLTSFPGRFKLAATLSHTDNNDKDSDVARETLGFQDEEHPTGRGRKPLVLSDPVQSPQGRELISSSGASNSDSAFVKYSDFTGSIHQLVICLSDTYKMKCLSVGEHIHVTAGRGLNVVPTTCLANFICLGRVDVFEQLMWKEGRKRKCNRIFVEGDYKTILEKTTLSTPDRDSNLDLPITGSLVYCESSALDHVATKAEKMLIHFAAVLYLVGAVSSQTNFSGKSLVVYLVGAVISQANCSVLYLVDAVSTQTKCSGKSLAVYLVDAVSSQTNCSGKSLVVYLVGAVISQANCSGKSLVVYLVGAVSSQANCSGKSLVVYLVGAVSSQTNCSGKSLVVYLVGTVISQTNCSGKSLVVYLVGAVSSQTICSVSSQTICSGKSLVMYLVDAVSSQTNCSGKSLVVYLVGAVSSQTNCSVSSQTICSGKSLVLYLVGAVSSQTICSGKLLVVYLVGAVSSQTNCSGKSLVVYLVGAVSIQTNCSAVESVSQLKVVSTSGSMVSIQWRAPSDTDCLEEYQVCWSLADGTQSNCTAQSRHEHTTTNITGLSPCTSYVINVTSVGSSGDSSEAVGTTATSAPDKVSQLKVTSTSVSTISIQWRPPSNADCLVGYQVCCSLADGTQSNCTTQTRHEHAATNITGLTPCTNFVVNVTTIGSSGNSSEAVDINVSSGRGSWTPPNSPGYGLDDAGIIVNAILLRFQQDSSSVLGHTEHQGLLLEACAVILRKTSWIHQSSSLGARELFDRPGRSVESHKRPKIPLE
uniref:Fibronectin type-III domain-containing protein n=1 Tax=Timema monikensis TaxID=170555 RepID=A0A7R9EAA6_9NEOP|nr:unnamed protein product [Timema monikensis]